jgi:poly(glycerol-phosphate) alpha-glucosyltransferase
MSSSNSAMNPCIRLAIVTHSLSRLGGGIVPVTQQLASELARLGRVELSILGLHDKFYDEDFVAWGGLSAVAFQPNWPSFLGRSKSLEFALEKNLPGILHTHGIWRYTSASVFRHSSSRNIPYIVSPHGMLDPWALENARWKKRIAAFMFEHRHLRNATCLHALCREEAASFRKFGLTNPICVIPNGVSGPAASDPASQLTISAIHSLPETSPYCLFLGRLHPKKGLVPLIQGWKELRSRGSKMNLVIAGWDDGGCEVDLRKQIDSLELRDCVKLVGPVFGKEKALLMQRASAFVLPSFSEGLPMSVLEAWSYQLPVIMTDECNLSESFSMGAALRIEPTPISIATTVTCFERLSGLGKAELGRLGKELVQQKFQWPTIAEKFAQVYDWALGIAERPSFVETI